MLQPSLRRGGFLRQMFGYYKKVVLLTEGRLEILLGFNCIIFYFFFFVWVLKVRRLIQKFYR